MSATNKFFKKFGNHNSLHFPIRKVMGVSSVGAVISRVISSYCVRALFCSRQSNHSNCWCFVLFIISFVLISDWYKMRCIWRELKLFGSFGVFNKNVYIDDWWWFLLLLSTTKTFHTYMIYTVRSCSTTLKIYMAGSDSQNLGEPSFKIQ